MAEPNDKPDSKSEKGKSPAEDRAAALTGKPEPDAPKPGQASQRLQEKKRAEGKGGKPVLTEKQRLEARRRRRAQKKRRPVTGNVLSRGLRATVIEVQRTLLFLGRSLLGGLDRIRPLGGILTGALSALLRAIGRGAAALAALAGAALKALGGVLLALDRVVTARRGLIVTSLVAGGLLIVSQFLDFRAIEVGQPGYVDVQEITRAPRLEAETPIDNHSLLLVVAGILAVVAAGAAAVTRKRVSGLALAVAGAVTVAVALLVDLPAGLDTADAELAFAGVKAVLLTGFWLEVGTGAVLLVSGIALILEAPVPERRQSRQRRTVNSPATGSRA